jgi:hypothetical protein
MLRKALLALTLFTSHFGLAYEIRQTWLDPKFVERAFIDVALKREYSPGDWALIKWQQPVKIWVDHRVSDIDMHDELTNAHIEHLSRVTGHQIQRVKSRDRANVIWLYTQESEWRDDVKREIGASALKNMHGAICKAGYRLNAKNNSIASAAIIIPVDQAREHGKLLACIVEEIAQVMGLPNDAETAFPSIFNDETPEDLLSPLDIILLKILYEPSLKPGMKEADVRPRLQAIIKRYQQQGILNRAVSDAKSGELYQLIGY